MRYSRSTCRIEISSFNEAPAGGRGMQILGIVTLCRIRASMRPRLEAGECLLVVHIYYPLVIYASMRPRLEAGECTLARLLVK